MIRLVAACSSTCYYPAQKTFKAIRFISFGVFLDRRTEVTMTLIVLLLRFLQALTILRISAFRATLSWTTLAAFFVYGFLAGPFAASALESFLAPYGTSGPIAAFLVRLLIGIAIFLVLLLPILGLHLS